MKTLSFLFLVCSLIAGCAQSTNASAPRVEVPPAGSEGLGVSPSTTNAPAARPSDTLSTELCKKVEPTAIILLQPKPNEITVGQVKVSGIAVEAVKTGPVKLINP